MKRLLGPAVAALLAGFVLTTPSVATAQSGNEDTYRDRRQTHHRDDQSKEERSHEDRRQAHNWDDQSKEKRTDQDYRQKESYQRAQERARQAKEEWERDQRSRKQGDQRDKDAQANRGDRQRDEISGQGKVRRTKKVGLRGQPVEHLVVLFRAPGSDRDRVADLGPVKNVRDARVRQGDNLRMIGRVVKVGDQQVLMVRKFYTSREPDKAVVIVRAIDLSKDKASKDKASKDKESQQRNQEERMANRDDRDRPKSRENDSDRRREESRSDGDSPRSASRQSENEGRDRDRDNESR